MELNITKHTHPLECVSMPALAMMMMRFVVTPFMYKLTRNKYIILACMI